LAVFDLDGTVVDSRQAIGEAVQMAWRTLGLDPPAYDQSRRIVGLSLDQALRTLAPDLPERRLPELTLAYQEAFGARRRAGERELLYEGALETLHALKREGWALGVATGKSRRGIDHVFAAHDIGGLFDAAFCADDGPGKPDPHMLQLNMRALGFAPEHTVMIGDTSFDMEMARAADCYALGVSWGFHTHDEIASGGAHVVVDAFPDLDATLAAWRTRGFT
jgi:phosphoglycolate phosphatase